jgi:hypothetical protein
MSFNWDSVGELRSSLHLPMGEVLVRLSHRGHGFDSAVARWWDQYPPRGQNGDLSSPAELRDR